jgi:hypothetical protein
MPDLTFDGGNLVYRDGSLGLDEACCCSVECGTNCQQSVSVSVAADGFSHTLTFTAADGFDDHSEFDGFDYFLVSAFLTCGLVDGSPVWTLSVSICWEVGGNFSSEDWEGTTTADGSGCPQTGAVEMAVTFGNGDATVTASIS